MRAIIAAFLTFVVATKMFAETIIIDDFEADLYSKSTPKMLKKLQTTLHLEVADDTPEAPIYDALNIVISSFLAENLLTSAGKEQFKKSLIKYTSEHHQIDIDRVFIIKMRLMQQVSAPPILPAPSPLDQNSSAEPTDAALKLIELYNSNQKAIDYGGDFAPME